MWQALPFPAGFCGKREEVEGDPGLHAKNGSKVWGKRGRGGERGREKPVRCLLRPRSCSGADSVEPGCTIIVCSVRLKTGLRES